MSVAAPIDTRIESAWFGKGDEISREAFELLTTA